MVNYSIEKSRIFKFLWLSIIPIIVLISIQFLVIAEERDVEDKTVTTIKNDSNDFETQILKNDISSNYLFKVNGKASHYAHKFQNRKTASGERFDMFDNTAAHRKLPFGTIIKVTNLSSGLSTLVKINDRGPHISRRILDLSYSAAKEIEGLGLPQIQIEGFLRGKHNIDKEFNQDYVYAYSLSQDPICVPRNLTSIVDSTTDFQLAFDKYKEIISTKSKQNTFLLVDADSNPRSEVTYYYIATIGKTQSKKGDITKL